MSFVECRLDALVEPMRQRARVPGVAVAIVSRNGVQLAKGYGYRDLRGTLPLTAQTVYPIASTTKAMTVTVLGMLIDEGKLAWDVPVQEYLPFFRVKDPLVSAQITVRDLIIMRTGLPRHDWAWIGSERSGLDLINSLRHLDASAGLRERYQYNNLGSVVAAHVAEIVTGETWQKLVRTRLFEPLGMRE